LLKKENQSGINKVLVQAIDFKDESDALYEQIKSLSDSELNKKTAFKDWSINNIIGHLHTWNIAADRSLTSTDDFAEYVKIFNIEYSKRQKMSDFEKVFLDGREGVDLIQLWNKYCHEVSDRFKLADPKKRVKWMGPDMSVKSSITARLMETWAHGQAIYDALGVLRVNEDRIKNITVLGNNTFRWCYTVHGRSLPEVIPYLKLTAPSGEIWTFNDASEENMIQGKAEDFCQVVTQVRNIADVKLNLVGDIAKEWMSIAQCFAGPAESPPAAGSRFTVIK
jgi:uncharacterized protein (TIGR03084 family)